MLILIAGIGKVGETLTEYISKEDHDIVVIDTDVKTLEETINKYDVLGVLGSGASYDILVEAGAKRADLIISVTESDELNILCCMIAKRLGTKHTIARVRDPIYSQQRTFMRDELGMNMTINPEYEAAYEISRVLRFPSALKIDLFAKGRVELAEIKLAPGNLLNGHSLAELQSLLKTKILICAVQRGDNVVIPSGDFVLNAGDNIYITAAHHEMAHFFKTVGIYRERVKTVIIIGGSDIAYYLAVLLKDHNMSVKIIEKDRQRCLELTELLSDTVIIHGDGTDKALLIEEGIEDVDACVTLTGLDEENIILSLYANSLNIDKVVTKVDRTAFTDLLAEIGIESVVSPKAATANIILRYVRSIDNVKGGSVQTLYKLMDGKIEALEFLIKSNKSITGIPLKNLKIKKNILVACIIRNNKLIFPFGSDIIENGDTLIIVSANHIIKDADDILE